MTITLNGSTGISVPDGTSTAPSIAGTTSATTAGIDFPAADVVAIITSDVEQFRVAAAGQIGIQGANYGTAGQILTSGGPSAAPSWSGSVAPTGLLIRAPQLLTTGTSYTTPTTCNSIYVELVGGGGGGGGCATGTGVTGGGGGGAAYVVKYVTVSPNTAYTYAIGAGGTVSGAQTGGTGGSSTITIAGTTYTAAGGVGGVGVTSGNGAGGAGGSGTNGDFNYKGVGGATNAASALPGFYGTPTGVFTSVGAGLAAANNTAGNPGTFYGCGGSGGNSATGGTTRTGGLGFQGIIRIWEYT